MRGEDGHIGIRGLATAETPPHAWGRHGQRRYCPFSTETPPHAWGRQDQSSSEVGTNRNTPTCVGKTQPHQSNAVAIQKHPHMRGEDPLLRERRNFTWKHPHMRGEDRSRTNPMRLPTETPPHAWGRRFSAFGRNRSTGNTPTCVGKTLPHVTSAGAVRKHPHMRGEDSSHSSLKTLPRETPPHAWGRP